MKPIVIAVAGGKKSGKTTTIEILTKELTRRGYEIAAVKHIPELDFTIDRERKDTWRYAQSGAKTVIGVSTDEIATIEKLSTNDLSLSSILRRCEGSDIVLLEGFRKLASKNKRIYKIVIVKSREDAEEAVRTFTPILAFTGSYSTDILNFRIPYVDMLTNPRKMADLVEKIREKDL